MKKLLFLLVLLPATADAQGAQSILQPTNPVPIMSNMVGQLAGELATTQALLQDSRAKNQQLQQQLDALTKNKKEEKQPDK